MRQFMATTTKKWLKERKIDVLDWPATSPDMNPIENLWGVLARKTYANGRQYESLSSLKACIMKEWGKIDQDLCYRLIRSMKSRCAAVLERQGRKVEY